MIATTKIVLFTAVKEQIARNIIVTNGMIATIASLSMTTSRRRERDIPMKLTKREQEVIHLRYVENKSLKEIADIYGVTKERIRQVEAKALWKTHKNNPEHSCDDCYHYWGTVPTCHNYPHRSKPCDDWKPKKEPKNATDAEKYDAYQEVWN